MAEPIFALKIGCFTCFCLNGTDRLEDLEHEFTVSPEQSPPSSAESSRESRRRRQRAEATPKVRSHHAAESSAAPAPLPVKRVEAAEARPTLLERRRLELPGTAPAKGGGAAGASPVAPPRDVIKTPVAAIPEQEEAADAEVAEATPEYMDLSGSWILSRIEGDMDAWLKDIGVAWAMRTGAKAMKYGVGKMTNVIEMTRDSITITTWTPKGDHTSVLKLDGSQSRNTDPMDGKGMLAVARWEDSTSISIETTAEDTGKKQPSSRRFLRDGEMCVEQKTPSGLIAKRWFVRQ